MKKNTRFFTLLLALTILLGALAACGGGETNNNSNTGEDTQGAQSSGYADTLIAVINSDPVTLDPQSSNMNTMWAVGRNFYEALVDENDGVIVPRLAKEWEYIDSTTVRFTLQEGVTFHDGTALTSEDVLFSFQRGLDNPVSSSTFQYFDVANSTIIDDLTFELKLTEPYAPLLSTLATGRAYIVSKQYVESVGDDKAAINPMGTGPYQFVSWTSGSEIRATRYDGYWQETAKTENLLIKVIPEASSRIIELETGNAHIIYEVDSSDMNRVNELPEASVVQTQSYRYYTVTFNMQDPILSDVRVREALSYAIDKEALTAAVFGDTASAANGFYPSVCFGFIETGVLPYDVDKAKELLADAGYADGLTLKFNYEARETDGVMADILQNMWAQVGVTVEMYSMDSATYTGQGNSFQIGMRAGNASDPANILIIYDSAFGDKIQSNDDALDAMIYEAMATEDETARAQLYADIQNYLYDMRYTVPLSFTDALYGVSDKVEGFTPHPNRQIELYQCAVAE